ncbi:hypothetical protein EF903_18860, partial [Streptomyces sp. WAC05292]
EHAEQDGESAGAAWGTAGAAASLLFLASDLGPLALTFSRPAGGAPGGAGDDEVDQGAPGSGGGIRHV